MPTHTIHVAEKISANDAPHQMPSGKNAEKKVHHRVRFSDRTKNYMVPALSDMTDEEINANWMTDEDSTEIHADITKTISAMRLGSKGADLCFRGLENLRSAIHLEQRKINIESALQAVFDEQERQWSAGKDDAEMIANAAASRSKQACDIAAALGESDAAVARRIHSVTEKGCLSSTLQKTLDVFPEREVPKVSRFIAPRRQPVRLRMSATHQSVRIHDGKAWRAKFVDTE